MRVDAARHAKQATRPAVQQTQLVQRCTVPSMLINLADMCLQLHHLPAHKMICSFDVHD